MLGVGAITLYTAIKTLEFLLYVSGKDIKLLGIPLEFIIIVFIFSLVTAAFCLSNG